MTINTPLIIQAKNVERHYGNIAILRGVDLDVHAGELVALFGPSGSGKTTLLNLIGTLDRPTAGSIEVLGKPLQALNEGQRARLRRQSIGFIFQSATLLPTYTAQENIDLALRLPGLGYRERQRRTDTALQLVGLSDWRSHMPEEMSGGQRQRIAIARALAMRPPIILADEPTSGLDTRTTRRMLTLFREFAALHGTCFVIVSHDPLLADFADSAYDLSEGRMIPRLTRQTSEDSPVETPALAEMAAR